MHNSKESTNDEKGEKTKSDQISRKIDVCIVGGGFAGMNAARILSEKQISCEIFSSGTGASNLWAGTFDVVESSDKQPSKLKEDVDRLSKKVPGHPYNALRWSEILLAMESFFEQIPNFRQFKDDKGSYLNRNVLTMLGKSKPCAASWNTIFCGMKELVETQRPCIVVNFVEFNNSTS